MKQIHDLSTSYPIVYFGLYENIKVTLSIQLSIRPACTFPGYPEGMEWLVWCEASIKWKAPYS